MAVTARAAIETAYAELLPAHRVDLTSRLESFAELYHLNGKPLCSVLAPVFVERATYEAAMAAAASFYRGLTGYLLSPAAESCPLLEGMPRRRALLADSIARGAPLGSRVDMLRSATGFKVLEFNPTTPGVLPFGVECGDPLASTFADSTLMQTLAHDHPCAPIPLHSRLLQSLTYGHARRGRSGAPGFAVVRVPTRPGVKLVSPEDMHEQTVSWWIPAFGFLGANGVAIQMCELDDVRYEGGVLSANGASIDVVLVDGDSEYWDVCPDDSPLWRALVDGAVTSACAYPQGNLLDDKGLMGDLSDAIAREAIDQDLARDVEKILPWTRRMRGGTTLYQGRDVHLDALVREERERFVLKPGIGTGGYEIHLGWKTSQPDWEAVLSNLPEGYIVQERVHGETVRLPQVEDGGEAYLELFYDFCPFVWSDGNAEGGLVRVSQAALLNLSQLTASIAPIFVLDAT